MYCSLTANNRPVFCQGCDYTPCVKCYKTIGKSSCSSCKAQHTLYDLLRRNPHLPKNFLDSFLLILSKEKLQEERRVYFQQLGLMELRSRLEELDTKIKGMNIDKNTVMSRKQLAIYTKKCKELEREAKNIKLCPVPDCNGTCSNSRCNKCDTLVCMKCMCTKTSRVDHTHGKDKCDPLKLLPHELEEKDEAKRRVLNPHVANILDLIEAEKAKIKEISKHTSKLQQLNMERQGLIDRLAYGDGDGDDYVDGFGDGDGDGDGDNDGNPSTSTSNPRKKRLPVAFCPKNDCNGCVFPSNWKCNSCHTKVCERCLEIKPDDDDEEAEEHVCDEGTLQTIELIRSTKSVRCPVCSLVVQDAGGCSQFWCSDEPGMGGCGTLFNKNTGKVLDPDTTYVHNPHALDARRRRREENGHHQPENHANNNEPDVDIACRNPVSRAQIQQRMRNEPIEGQNTRFGRNLDPAYILADTNHNILQSRRFCERRIIPNLEKLRFSFFKGRITEEEWLKELKRIMKRISFSHEVRPVFETYTETIHTISWEYILHRFNTEEFFNRLDSLKKMTQDNFGTISRVFNYSDKLEFGEVHGNIQL